MNYVSFLAVFLPQVRRRKPFLFGYLLIFQMLGNSPALHLNMQDDGGAAVSLLLNCFLAFWPLRCRDFESSITLAEM